MNFIAICGLNLSAKNYLKKSKKEALKEIQAFDRTRTRVLQILVGSSVLPTEIRSFKLGAKQILLVSTSP